MREIQDLIRFWKSHLGQPLALATLVRAVGSTYRRCGAMMLITAQGMSVGSISGGCLEREVVKHAVSVLQTGRPQLLSFDTRLLLGCHGHIEVLVEHLPSQNFIPRLAESMALREAFVTASVYAAPENDVPLGTHAIWPQLNAETPSEWPTAFARQMTEAARASVQSGETTSQHGSTSAVMLHVIPPPIQLLVIGNGPDVPPLVEIAGSLGWHVIVAIRPGDDLDPAIASGVKVARITSLDELDWQPDRWSAAVIMSHNFGRDCAFLRSLVATPVPYLGLLGSRQRRERLLAELAEHDLIPTNEWFARLFAPAGLNLGAESPDEIALAIVAEIKAVLARKPAGFLRDQSGTIHPRPAGINHHPTEVATGSTVAAPQTQLSHVR